VAYDKFPLEIGGQLEEMPVYELPTSLLSYNVRNGRFAIDLAVKERQIGRSLDPDLPDDVVQIEAMLLDLSPSETTKLMDDIKNRGQIYPGVITWDGYVINGNRRMAVLRTLHKQEPTGKFERIKVFRLPKDFAPREVWRLEAGAQLSAEMRDPYSPINELLKYREGSQYGFSAEEMAAALYGRTAAEVREALERLQLIDQYLEYIGKPNEYVEVRRAHERFIEVQTNIGQGRRYLDDAQLECFTRAQFDMIRADNIDNYELRELRTKVLRIPNSLAEFLARICPEATEEDEDDDHIDIPPLDSEDSAESTAHEPAGPAEPPFDPNEVRQLFDDVVEIARGEADAKKPVTATKRALTSLESIDEASVRQLVQRDQLNANLASIQREIDRLNGLLA
jgi:hypothetical protein